MLIERERDRDLFRQLDAEDVLGVVRRARNEAVPPFGEDLERVGEVPAPQLLRPRLDAGLFAQFAPRRLGGRLVGALEFPQWFGGNWDALEDCLTDLSWASAGGHVLLIEGAAGLPADESGIFTDILASAAAWWAGRGRPFFAVFVGGAEGLPELYRRRK